MIGWDPLAGRIVSWTFSSDGRFAAGVWTPTDAGCTVATVGVMPDGTFGKDSDTVMETGLDNLTKAEAPALIHFGAERTEQWMPARIDQPSEQNQAPQNGLPQNEPPLDVTPLDE